MKNKIIFAIALAFTMTFASVVMVSNSANISDAYAKEKVELTSSTGDEWSDYFDYVTEGEVTYTPNKKNNSYDGLVYSTSQNKEVGQDGVGLGVNITRPTTFTYKKKINLSMINKDFNLFEIYANPLTPSPSENLYKVVAPDGEFSSFEVRLTDDDGNYIAIESNFSMYDIRLGWVSAYTNNLSSCGLQDGKINRTPKQGTPTYISYPGRSKNSLSLYLDYENKELWASSGFLNFDTYDQDGKLVTNATKKKTLVRSFVDNDHLSLGEKPFAGFTSDEVTVTIDFPFVTGDYGANFIILALAGNRLTGEKFNDNNIPTIFIDEDIDIDNVPVAQKDRFYPLFGYTGTDVFDGDITSSVVIDVYDPDGVKLSKAEIKNGGFTPRKVGEYTVTYNLVDSSGNIANPVIIKVPVESVIPYVSMNLDETKFTVNNKSIQNLNSNIITASVGDRISLAPFTCSGGSGTLKTSVTVKDKDGYLSIYNNVFNLRNDGYTVITYTVTDYLGDEVTKHYYINVSYNPKPILDSVFLQRAIKQGSRVNVNIPKAYDYYSVKGVKLEVDVNVEISEDNGVTYEKFNGGLYAIKNSQTDKILVKYTAKSLSSEEKVEEIYEIKVAKPSGKYNAYVGKDYFDIDGEVNVEYVKQPNGVYAEAEFSPVNEGASMQFINPMRDLDANLTFNLEAPYSKFNKFAITFNGAYNYKEQVTIELSKLSHGILITTPSSAFEYSGVYVNGRDSSFTIKLDVDGVLKVNGIITKTIYNYDNGEQFNGFSGSRIFTTIKFDSFEEGAKVRFTDVGYIPLITNTMKDNIAPTITVNDNVTTYHDVYDVVKIPTAIAFDAISPDIDVTFSLFDPKGLAIYENFPAEKDYYFTLTTFGTYVLEYTTQDENNNKINRSINIVSIDNIAPVIEVNGQFKSKYKVGDTINIPNYAVMDNYYEGVSSYVFVTTPTYGMKVVTVNGDASSYKFQVAGRYTITYYAMDNAANYTVKEFVIMVE